MGIAVSSALFAQTHLLGIALDPMMFLDLMVFGVSFALWALHEGSLWGVFGSHAAVNWVSGNVIVVGEGAGVGLLPADATRTRCRGRSASVDLGPPLKAPCLRNGVFARIHRWGDESPEAVESLGT
jgi:hypothetical protein